MLGLHINMAKSELVPVGEVLNMGEFVALLGCRQAVLTANDLFGASVGS